jgi:hypothetical protein
MKRLQVLLWCCLVLLCALPALADQPRDILVLTDIPFSPMADSMQRLYPERVAVIDVQATACPASPPAGTRVVVSVLTDPANTNILNQQFFAACWEQGLTVITGLDEYAFLRKCRVTTTPIKAQYREFDPANFRTAIHTHLNKNFRLTGEDPVANKPKVRFVATRPWTKGFAVNDELHWYGLLDPATKYRVKTKAELYTEDPEYKRCHWYRPDLSYQEQMWADWEQKTERFFYQHRLEQLPADFAGVVIGVSTVDGKPVIIEEPKGKGRLIALDLRAPEEPIFHVFRGEGCYNKYVLIGNLCGNTVQFGRFWSKWPTPDEMNEQMREFAKQHSAWTLIKEVEYDYDPAGVEIERQALGLPQGFLKSHYDNYSLNIGDLRKPIYFYTGSTHGTESIGGLGLLSFIDEVNQRLPQDETLQRFLEHYALKILPLNNPHDYQTLFYRDPWSGPGWRMRSVNPDADKYTFFLGHDIHGNPGGGSAQQGNGKVADEAVRRTCEAFQGRYLEAPNHPHYGTYFMGYGNIVGEMRPRQRMCVFPKMTYRDYSMGTEMPDIRFRWSSDSTLIPVGEKKYGSSIGKIWPQQTFFTLAITDIVGTYIYNEILPRPWAYTEVASPDPAWKVRLWRYNPEQTTGTMIATFRKNDSTALTAWEYLDVVTVGKTPPVVQSHKLDGRLHVSGVQYSYPLAEGGLRENRAWREENTAGPIFHRWHWLQHPDAFRPLVKAHWVLWDTDADGTAETYLVDAENDGVYEKRVGGQQKMAGKTIGYLGDEGGWGDLSTAGLSALGTWAQAQQGTMVTVKPGDPLDTLAMLVVGACRDEQLTPEFILQLRTFVQGGGRLLITLPDADLKELDQQQRNYHDGENDWEVRRMQKPPDTEGWYRERLLPYAKLCAAFGVLPQPRRVSSYRRIHGDWCWFDQFFTEKTGFADLSGMNLVAQHERLMLDSYALQPVSPSMKTVLTLHGDPVLVWGNQGKGAVLVSGSADLFTNRAVCEKLHEPLVWHQPDLPAPSTNIALRHRLFSALLEGQCPGQTYQPNLLTDAGVSVSAVGTTVSVTWTGADGQPRHWAINRAPNGGTPGYLGKCTLGFGEQREAVEYYPHSYIADRSRFDVEVDYGSPLRVILRMHHEFAIKNQVYAEYVFTFAPGKDHFTVEHRMRTLDFRRPFAMPPPRVAGKGAQWNTTTDAKRQLQYVTDGHACFGMLRKQGEMMVARFVEPGECAWKAVVFIGQGDGGETAARLDAASFEDLIRIGAATPPPLLATWRMAFDTLQKHWQAREAWAPSTAEIEQGWAVEGLRHALQTRQPEKAKQYETLLPR